LNSKNSKYRLTHLIVLPYSLRTLAGSYKEKIITREELNDNDEEMYVGSCGCGGLSPLVQPFDFVVGSERAD
jgi:hypothetical protein